MKKCNGMIALILVGLCVAPKSIHASEESSGFDYNKLTRHQKTVGMGLGAGAVAALGYWGIPKIREWWGGPTYVYNKYISKAKDTFIKFERSFYDEASPFSIINKTFKSGSFDEDKSDKIENKNDLKELLESTMSDLNALRREFHAKSLTKNRFAPIFTFGIIGSIVALSNAEPSTEVVGSMLSGAFIGGVLSWIYRSNSIVGMGEKISSVRESLAAAMNAFSKQYNITVDTFKNSADPLEKTIQHMSKFVNGDNGNEEDDEGQKLKEDFSKSWNNLTTLIDRITKNLNRLNKISLPDPSE